MCPTTARIIVENWRRCSRHWMLLILKRIGFITFWSRAVNADGTAVATGRGVSVICTTIALQIEMRNNQREKDRAAQHGAGADAAVRPQDRRHFESWNRPDRLADLSGRRSSAPDRWARAINAKLISETDQTNSSDVCNGLTYCSTHMLDAISRLLRFPCVIVVSIFPPHSKPLADRVQ